MSELYDERTPGEGNFIQPLHVTYHNRWPELLGALPQAATCLGGTGAPPQPQGVVAAVWDPALKGTPCIYCGGLEEEHHTVDCDRCEACAHARCSRTPVH